MRVAEYQASITSLGAELLRSLKRFPFPASDELLEEALRSLARDFAHNKVAQVGGERFPISLALTFTVSATSSGT